MVRKKIVNDLKWKNWIMLVPLAIVVIVVMYLTLNVNASVQITTNSGKKGTNDPQSEYVTNQGTLTVTDQKQNIGNVDQLQVYKIIDTYYNRSSDTIVYQFTSDFKTFLDSSGSWKQLTESEYLGYSQSSGTSGSSNINPFQSSSNFAKLMSAYAGYIRTNSKTGTNMTYDSGNWTNTATLDVGSYLVLPVSTSNVYGVMVGNIELKKVGVTYEISNGSIVAKVEKPNITKTCEYDEESGTNISARVGGEVTCTVTATFPTYPKDAQTTNNNATIKLTKSKLDFISPSESGEKFTVESTNFASCIWPTSTGDNHQYNLSCMGENVIGHVSTNGNELSITDIDKTKVSGSTLTIKYKFNFNPEEEVTYGGSGYNIPAEFSYPEPYSSELLTRKSEDMKIYTYALRILGYPGAVFTLYKQNGNKEIESNITLVGTGQGVGSEGNATIKGLAKGTYYLKQTKAPSGFNLLTSTPTFIVGPGGTVYSSQEGWYKVEAYNQETTTLPFTGGIGTVIFIAIGLIIIGGATIFIIYHQKKQQTNE